MEPPMLIVDFLFIAVLSTYSSNKKLQSVTDSVVFNLLSGDIYYASKNKGSFVNEKKLDLTNKNIKPTKDMVIGLNIFWIYLKTFLFFCFLN